MNTKLIIIGALAALVTGVALAQPPYGGPRLDRLTAVLDLNEQQQAQVQQVLDEQQVKRTALHDETITRLKTVLTPEQAAKLDGFIAARGMHRGAGMGRMGGMGGYGGVGPCWQGQVPAASQSTSQ